MSQPLIAFDPADRGIDGVQRLLLLAGLLAGFALRLFQLGSESLWYDETVSVYLARLPVPALLAHTAGDIHPPGYYLLLHLWQRIAHPSLAHGLETLFAWPSLWAGLLVMAMLFAVGRRLFNGSVALVTLWLAAVNPFQLWYSQEVRMYTVGAALSLLCLWALLRFLDGPHRILWLAVFALAAATGLYTLYYFLFLLVALNLVALLQIWRQDIGEQPVRSRLLLEWLGTQILILVLWLPWLPIFWRQVVQPPVPPWRQPWRSWGELLASIAETLGALLVGQSPPGYVYWPWAMCTLALLFLPIALIARTKRSRQLLEWFLGVAMVLLFVFVPIVLLYAITFGVAPIYHVRYLFIYAPPFLLLPAVAIVALWRTRPCLGMVLLALLFALSAAGLAAFWFDPLYRADDHRRAVANLAAAWRPGDAILANAGWIYPVLTTYWPTDLVGLDATTPPPLSELQRLNDYADRLGAGAEVMTSPLVLRTGSVDGDPTLGWGNPASDFYPLSAADTTAALRAVAGHHPRIWHYRLYDTVSDPASIIRTWLASNTTRLAEQAIPGRDFGLLQLFETPADTLSRPASQEGGTLFDAAVQLLGHTVPRSVEAGTYLYADLFWQPLPGLIDLPTGLSMSLRLYDAGGHLAAQADSPPLPPTLTWALEAEYRQPMALPVAVNTKPGSYSLQLVIYRQDTGAPLPPLAKGHIVDGQRWEVGTVVVTPSTRAPRSSFLPPVSPQVY